MTELQTRANALRDRIPGFTAAALAGHTTLSYSSVQSWMKGSIAESETLRRDLEPVIRRLERGDIELAPLPGSAISIDDLEPEGRQRRVRKNGAHYDIGVTRKIHRVLDYCYTEAALGVVTVGFGGGKSHAIRMWREKHPKVNCVVLEFGEFSVGNKCWFIHELAEKLQVKTPSGGMVAGGRVFRAVVEHLREIPALLIFDQCEAIRVQVAQVIRQVWDATRDDGTGVVLLGAHKLREKLQAGRSQDLGALTSRVCPWDSLSGVKRGEMEQILKCEGITDVRPKAMDLLWTAVNGSMRLLMHAVRLIHAKHKGEPITERVVEELCAFLCGAKFRSE